MVGGAEGIGLAVAAEGAIVLTTGERPVRSTPRLRRSVVAPTVSWPMWHRRRDLVRVVAEIQKSTIASTRLC